MTRPSPYRGPGPMPIAYEETPMTETPIADAAQAATMPAGTALAPRTATALEIPTLAEVQQILGIRRVDMRQWMMALAEQEQFEETDTEDNALSLLRGIFAAQSSEQVFDAMNMQGAKDLIGEEPGASTAVLEFHSAFPLASTYDEGPSCFGVFSTTQLADGKPVSFSCGARAVQGAMIMHMISGWVPFKAKLVRRRKPTRKGFYPLNLESGI